MPKKDYQGYLSVIGEVLKQDALVLKAEVAGKKSYDEGTLTGYALALDTMLDYLEMFNLKPKDLGWKDFIPERDLLSGRKPMKRKK